MWLLIVIVIQSSAGWIHPKAIVTPWYGFENEAACRKAVSALEQATQRNDQTVFYRCQREVKP